MNCLDNQQARATRMKFNARILIKPVASGKRVFDYLDDTLI